MAKSVRHRPNCANSSCQCGKSVKYAQTMRELVVPMRKLIGTHSCARRELFVNYACTRREQSGSLPVPVPKIARLATTKSWPKVVQVSN